MDHMNYLRDWLERAERAGFVPFEIVDPAPTSSEPSGFGGNSSGSLHCAIAQNVNGEEFFIATSVDETPETDDECDRREILGVVQSLLEDAVTLPFTLDLTFEERTAEILVDDAPVTFRGIISAGHSEWSLRADIDRRTNVLIQGPRGANPPVAIRRGHDLRLSGLISRS